MDRSIGLLADSQRQTLPTHQALAEKFTSSADKTEHFRRLAQKSHERGITLSGDETAALVDAYSLLGRIAERARVKLGDAPNEAN